MDTVTDRLMRMRIISLTVLVFATLPLFAGAPRVYNNADGIVHKMADPYILQHDGRYYLYGTDDAPPAINKGFTVRVSTDLVNWSAPCGAGPEGRALDAPDVFGERAFWSAQVNERNGVFYMFYTAEEHIAVATSSSPLGPFVQKVKTTMRPQKTIGGMPFIDTDGRAYLFYTAFDNKANEVFVEEMTDDWMSAKPETRRRCIWWTQPWENSDPRPKYKRWPVNEGASILKHKGIYYMFYTANHFMSPKYAVGYATAATPLGPWIKSKDNPVLSQTPIVRGVGSVSFVTAPNGDRYIVYHAHKTPDTVLPRKMCMDRIEFVPNQVAGQPDIPKIHGPTDTPVSVPW
ncbi:glycoside hydrolase family 43 protein [Ereboglobus luteus]|nr:glycoside hydrolase family 43 protein [Ereboglobus luteus]